MDDALLAVWFRQVAGRPAGIREVCGGLARGLIEQYGADLPEVVNAVDSLRLAVYWSDQAMETVAELASRDVEPEPEPDRVAEALAALEPLTDAEREALGVALGPQHPRTAGERKALALEVLGGLQPEDQAEVLDRLTADDPTTE